MIQENAIFTHKFFSYQQNTLNATKQLSLLRLVKKYTNEPDKKSLNIYEIILYNTLASEFGLPNYVIKTPFLPEISNATISSFKEYVQQNFSLRFYLQAVIENLGNGQVNWYIHILEYCLDEYLFKIKLQDLNTKLSYFGQDDNWNNYTLLKNLNKEEKQENKIAYLKRFLYLSLYKRLLKQGYINAESRYFTYKSDKSPQFDIAYSCPELTLTNFSNENTWSMIETLDQLILASTYVSSENKLAFCYNIDAYWLIETINKLNNKADNSFILPYIITSFIKKLVANNLNSISAIFYWLARIPNCELYLTELLIELNRLNHKEYWIAALEGLNYTSPTEEKNSLHLLQKTLNGKKFLHILLRSKQFYNTNFNRLIIENHAHIILSEHLSLLQESDNLSDNILQLLTKPQAAKYFTIPKINQIFLDYITKLSKDNNLLKKIFLNQIGFDFTLKFLETIYFAKNTSKEFFYNLLLKSYKFYEELFENKKNKIKFYECLLKLSTHDKYNIDFMLNCTISFKEGYWYSQVNLHKYILNNENLKEYLINYLCCLEEEDFFTKFNDKANCERFCTILLSNLNNRCNTIFSNLIIAEESKGLIFFSKLLTKTKFIENISISEKLQDFALAITDDIQPGLTVTIFDMLIQADITRKFMIDLFKNEKFLYYFISCNKGYNLLINAIQLEYFLVAIKENNLEKILINNLFYLKSISSNLNNNDNSARFNNIEEAVRKLNIEKLLTILTIPVLKLIYFIDTSEEPNNSSSLIKHFIDTHCNDNKYALALVISLLPEEERKSFIQQSINKDYLKNYSLNEAFADIEKNKSNKIFCKNLLQIYLYSHQNLTNKFGKNFLFHKIIKHKEEKTLIQLLLNCISNNRPADEKECRKFEKNKKLHELLLVWHNLISPDNLQNQATYCTKKI